MHKNICTIESHEAQKLTTNPVIHYLGYQVDNQGLGIFYFDCPHCSSTLAVTNQQMGDAIARVQAKATHLLEIVRAALVPEPAQSEVYTHYTGK